MLKYISPLLHFLLSTSREKNKYKASYNIRHIYSLLGSISFIVQDQDAQRWPIAVQSSPSVIAFASSAFLDALAVSTASTLTCVHAGAFDFHETSITATFSCCRALTVIAILTMWHASASRSVFRNNRRILYSKSEIRVHENKPVIAFTNFRRDACAVVTGRTDGLASAGFRVLVAVKTYAEIRRRARAIAAFDAANRFASERNVFRVVINHAITVFADAAPNANLRPGAGHRFPAIYILACLLTGRIPGTLAVLLVFLAFLGKKHVKILIALIIYI